MLLIHYTQPYDNLQNLGLAMNDDIFFGDIRLDVPQDTRADRMSTNAQQFAALSEEAEKTKQTLAYLREIILADLPEEPGEYNVRIDTTRTLVVTIPEKWEWDKKLLADMFPVAHTPDCVSTSYTVDKRKYEAASPEVKSQMSQALTIKCGAPTMKVQSI